MKTFKNIFFTLLLLAAGYWIVTQGDTTDGGKLIRLGTYIASAYLWANKTTWGHKIIRK